MQARCGIVMLSVVIVLCAPGGAFAQGSIRALASVFPVDTVRPGAVPPRAQNPPASATQMVPAGDDMTVSVYPVLLWLPSFSAEVNVPPFPDDPNGPDLPGGSGSTESSFDGAALAGLSIEKGSWRLDIDGIWAAVGAERETPNLTVDADVIYGRVSGGWKIYKDLYLTAGLRRVAIDYDIQINGRGPFDRKPGVWDPLIGLGWHSTPERKLRLHVLAEGGGFGAGADVDLSGTVRADVRFTRHFGLTLGYSALYLELSNTIRDRTLEVKQTMHGPIAGVGFYF